MTRVAILWHMHQPYYEDLVTHEHILPWVRLHALKDYYGMVALLEEFPDVRVTFNLVPSLLVQLEAFAAHRARDRYLEVGLKPADDLTEQDVAFILQNFFHAQRQRMIDIYPRYAELLDRRGPMTNAADARASARRFTVDDLRDLQVWQKLAWVDPLYMERDDRVGDLLTRGRNFTEDDKATLRAVELDLLNAVVPAYRYAAARGQVELSTSPFYHPILPLLCDTDVYRPTRPELPLPRRRFAHPEDAAEHLARAVRCHERLFGRRPVGLWPSEGSVSDAMVPLVAEAGFDWMATDELILSRTLGAPFARDGEGLIDQPERLYVPYGVRAGGARVVCLFRDHSLSDLIGFTYARWPAEQAADDFVSRLVAAGRLYSARSGGEEAIVSVILDGENAWEHYEGGGRPFLRALYRRLSGHSALKTVTMSEACRKVGPELKGIFPGSWIDADFYIWIGHRDDQRAWSQLVDAHAAIEAHTGHTGHTERTDQTEADRAAVSRAREEVLIAEGSDWFWWYGDDHSSDHDLDFDDLYRRHLRNVYRLLQKPVPDELFVSNISVGAAASGETAPTGLLAPVIDGEVTSYFEWLGAGRLEIRETSGAMHRSDPAPTILTLLQFGFDDARLYVRLDGVAPLGDVLAEGYQFSVTFLRPEGIRVLLRKASGDAEGVVASLRGVTAAAGTILELAVPLDDLRTEDSRIAFFVAVSDPSGLEVERHPALRPIEADIPDAWFEARNWTA